MAIEYGQAKVWGNCQAHITITDWLSWKIGEGPVVCAEVRAVSLKAVGVALSDDDDLLTWLALSHIEDIVKCTGAHARGWNERKREQSQGRQGNRQEYQEQRKEEPKPPPRQESGNPYDILGVSRQATSADIVRSYKEKIHALHPDINPGAQMDSEVAALLNRKAAALNAAFDQLKGKK